MNPRRRATEQIGQTDFLPDVTILCCKSIIVGCRANDCVLVCEASKKTSAGLPSPARTTTR